MTINQIADVTVNTPLWDDGSWLIVAGMIYAAILGVKELLDLARRK